MSELIERLSARLESDIKRGIPFHEGMMHFTQFVRESIKEIDMKTLYVESLVRKLKR